MKNQNESDGENGDGGEAEGNFFVLRKPHLRVRNSSDNFASYRRATSVGRAGPSRCRRRKKLKIFTGMALARSADTHPPVSYCKQKGLCLRDRRGLKEFPQHCSADRQWSGQSTLQFGFRVCYSYTV